MELDVYGVGNTLVDILANISDELLAELGFARGAMTLVDHETQQRVLAALDPETFTRCAGGSAANTILGIAGFGGRAAYAGKVGDDELGRFCLDDLRASGVAVDIPLSDGPTGTCLVLVTDDAQRTMLTFLGVSADVGPDDVDRSLLEQAEWVYIEGYLFSAELPRSAARRAIELAGELGTRIALTVSDPFLVEGHRDEFLELAAGPVDLLFCNEDEARSLCGLDDATECGRRLGEQVERVAVTLGSQGAVLIESGRLSRVDGVPTEAVDTTGAGDMFAAGILYGLTNGLGFEQSARLANHAASRIVSQRGARLAEPIPCEEISHLAGGDPA